MKTIISFFILSLIVIKYLFIDNFYKDNFFNTLNLNDHTTLINKGIHREFLYSEILEKQKEIIEFIKKNQDILNNPL